ncbi:hypothetical protein BT69DRAFT_1298386 [Atractiella rhizophila]|nr:hypothetical protein BT69DRAFT_1298386 [Atractiella rhizophila]
MSEGSRRYEFLLSAPEPLRRAFCLERTYFPFDVNNHGRRAILAVKPQGNVYTFLSYRRSEIHRQYFFNNGLISETSSPGAELLHFPKDAYPDILLIKIWSDGKSETSITLLNDRKNWLKGMAFFLADSVGHCSHLDDGGSCKNKFEFFGQRFVFDQDRLPTNLRVRQPPMKKPGVIAQHIAVSCGRFNGFPALKRVCESWSRQSFLAAHPDGPTGLPSSGTQIAESFNSLDFDGSGIHVHVGGHKTQEHVPSFQGVSAEGILLGWTASALSSNAPNFYAPSTLSSSDVFTTNMSNNINGGMQFSVQLEQDDGSKIPGILQVLQEFARFTGTAFDTYQEFVEQNKSTPPHHRSQLVPSCLAHNFHWTFDNTTYVRMILKWNLGPVDSVVAACPERAGTGAGVVAEKWCWRAKKQGPPLFLHDCCEAWTGSGHDCLL